MLTSSFSLMTRAVFPLTRVLVVHAMLWIGTLVLVHHVGGTGTGTPFLSLSLSSSSSPSSRLLSTSSAVLSMPLPATPPISSLSTLHHREPHHGHGHGHRDRAHRHHHRDHAHAHLSLLHPNRDETTATLILNECSNITTCIDIGANTTSPQPCGWCWDTNTALPGNAQGPFNASGIPCEDWTYTPESCILHIDCTQLPSCENILGTSCGWCETTEQGMPGTASGPRDGSCDDWIYAATLCPSTNQPQQVHLSYSTDPTIMVVTWSSSQSSDSVAYYYDMDEAASASGGSIMWLKATGDTTYFLNNNELGFKYIHRVNMSALVPGHLYLYFVANGGIRSPGNFTFRAMPLVNDIPARFIVFGDMGRYGGAPSLQALIDEVHGVNVSAAASSDSADAVVSAISAFSDIPVTAVLHVGDFAYDLLTDLGMNGDAFFQRIERIAGYVPYLPCVGNHEIEFDNSFSHYRNRFTTPSSWVDDGWRMWWSVDVQLVHFVSYSTEVLFEDPQKLASAQMDWLRADLKQANANRAERPWIVAFGHRPMYCSNNDGDDCTTDQSVTRLALETLFYEMGVDIILEAHEHSYERLWPVYNLTVTQEDYVNPRAPVHLITGQAGCNEDDGVCINTIPGPRGAWSAFRQSDSVSYGYGHLVPVNATHLYWDQVMVEDKDQVLDAIWIVQHNHGPFRRVDAEMENEKVIET